MICLAVNTANTLLSLALTRDGSVLQRFDSTQTRDQGNLLLQHARAALDKEKLAYTDLNLLAVTTGPGSFTGIRIGLATMRGLALAAKVPVMGISSFALYVAPKPGHTNIVVLESWREELYFEARNGAGDVVISPVNVTPEDFLKMLPAGETFVLSGDAAEKLHRLMPAATLDTTQRDAADVARIAVASCRKGTPPERPLPFYLREPDVTMSGKKGNA